MLYVLASTITRSLGYLFAVERSVVEHSGFRRIHDKVVHNAHFESGFGIYSERWQHEPFLVNIGNMLFDVFICFKFMGFQKSRQSLFEIARCGEHALGFFWPKTSNTGVKDPWQTDWILPTRTLSPFAAPERFSILNHRFSPRWSFCLNLFGNL